MMGMGQRPPPRPQMGPSPMTAGRPNPMAGFQGGGGPGMINPAPRQVPNFGSFAPPQGGAQGVGPNFGGYQGTPPWLGGGGGPIQMMDNANAGGLQTGVFDPNMPLAPGVKFYGGGMFSGPAAPPPGGFGGGPPGTPGGTFMGPPPDAMVHPFAPRNRGAQGVGPMQGQIQNSLVGMQGAMGGGAQGVGPNMILPAAQQMQGAMGGGPMQQMQGALGQMQMDALPGGAEPRFQRRFPGALSRGIMQGMAPPPQMAQAAPPAPYGGQQFRMW